MTKASQLFQFLTSTFPLFRTPCYGVQKGPVHNCIDLSQDGGKKKKKTQLLVVLKENEFFGATEGFQDKLCRVNHGTPHEVTAYCFQLETASLSLNTPQSKPTPSTLKDPSH